MSEWKRIKDDAGIRELWELANGFHDSCIVSASYASGMYVTDDLAMGRGDAKEFVLELALHCQSEQTELRLRFIGVRAFHIEGFDEDRFGDIQDARLEFTDGFAQAPGKRVIFWSDWAEFSPADADKCGASYAAADAMEWRFAR